MLGTLYAAVDDDAAWSAVFRQIATATGSRTAGMFRVDGTAIGFEQSWNMPAEFMREFGQHYVADDPRVARALAHPLGTILSDDHPDVRRGMVQNGVDQLARSYDMPHTMASLFRCDPNALWAVYLSRSARQGVHGEQEAKVLRFLLEHVNRVIALRLRLAEADMRMHAACASDDEPTALILIDAARQLHWASPEAEALLREPEPWHLRQGAVHLGSAILDRDLEYRISHVDLGLPPLAVGIGSDRHWALEVLPYHSRDCMSPSDPLFLVTFRHHRVLVALANLTHRQHTVLTLLQRGMANKQIADQLGLSTNTVRNHMHALFDRLGARNRTECVSIARQLEVV